MATRNKVTNKNNTEDTEDEEFILKTLYNQYWYLMQLSYVYPDYRNGFRRYLSILQGIIFAFTAGYALTICSLTAIKIQEDLLIASQGLHFFILQVATLTVVISTNAKRNNYKHVHKTIGIGPVEYDEETKNGMKIVQDKLNKRKNYLISGIIGYLVFAAFVTVIIAPFIDSLTNGSNENIYSPGGVSLNLPIPLWSPFGTHTTWGYLISMFMELLCAYEMTSIVVAGDVALLVSTQYLTMELQLLTTALKRMPERTIRLYKSNHNIDPEIYININYMRDNGKLLKCYGYCLKETAVHYQKIIKAFADINAVISVPTFVGYFCGSIVIAISAIVMIFGKGNIGTLITSIFLFFGEVLNMMILSWSGEQLHSGNNEFIKALYSTKWYYANKEEALTLRIMMNRSQRPLTLLAGGMIPLNFETFSNVMNSAYSYFNLMYASKMED